MTVVVVIVAIVVVVAIVVFLMRRRRPDPVDSFRRQIDALSPEARRPTIDQVKATEDETGTGTDGDGSPADDGTDST